MATDPRSPPTSQLSRREATLLEAAQYGQTQRAERLIDAGNVDVDFVDPEGRSALHHAASGGHEKIVESLIRANCDVDFSSRIYGTALCLAALRGRFTIAKMLLDAGADINAPGGDLGSALHAGCEGGDMDLFRLLLEHGAAVDAVRIVDNCLANKLRDSTFDTSYLPAGMRYHYTYGQPIARAANMGRLEMVRELLSRGVDLEAMQKAWYASTDSKHSSFDSADPETRAKCSTLGKACGACHAEIAEELLRRGADPNLSSTPGPFIKPLLAAVAAKNKPSQRLRCMLLLLDAGANVNAVNQKGVTALFIAVHHNHEDAVELLLQRGADPNPSLQAPDQVRISCSPLTFAPSISIVTALVQHGAKVTADALAFALQKPDRTPIVQKLLELGADPNGKIDLPRDPATSLRLSVYPLHIAIQYRQRETSLLLLKYDANPKLVARDWREKLRDLVGEENVPGLQSLGKRIEGRMGEGVGALKKLVHGRKKKSESRSDASSSRSVGKSGVPERESGQSRPIEDDEDEESDRDEVTLCGDEMGELGKMHKFLE